MSKQFKVEANGTAFGIYEADDEQGARDACAVDAGYKSEADMAERLGTASALVAVELGFLESLVTPEESERMAREYYENLCDVEQARLRDEVAAGSPHVHDVLRRVVADHARLMVAAPKLLAALEEARNGLEWYRDRNPEQSDGSDDEAFARIDAAIAEAKGE